MDLEQEFQKLMDEVVSKIENKRKSGDLSDEEADDLIHMVATRRNARAWSYSSDCYTDDEDYGDPDDDRGWSRSSWCGDNG